MIKTYYWLTKPGIIYGNAVTGAGGFFLASKGHIDFLLLLTTLAGLSFIIASACVINNIFDKDIDAKMERTHRRAIVQESISKSKAFIFATILGLLGVAILLLLTNQYALLTALTGWIVYVALYSPLKRATRHATLIGALSGATPPVVGYVAVTKDFDLGALLLFLILIAWQMPHFYSIAVYRLHDYTTATIPVLPVKKGIFITKIHIMIYIIIFIFMASLLTVFNYTGYVYLVVMLLLGVIWLRMSFGGFRPQIDPTLWARQMFRFSLVVITLFSLLISIDGIINI